MNARSPMPLRRRVGWLLRSLALVSVLALGAACGGSSADHTAPVVKPNAEKASAALDAGVQAHADGDLATATDDYNTTLKYDATNKFAFYNLALIDESAGNYGLAEAKYRSAIKTDPTYEPALFNLAILRTARDHPQEAIELYQRAVAADKKDAAAWLNLGLLLRADGQEHAGDKDVLRAIALDPSLRDPRAPADSSGPADD